MEAYFMNTILSLITIILTTILTLYINDNYKKKKEYKDFLDRLKNIVGLGGKIIFKFNHTYQLCQVEKIDDNGMILVHDHKKIYIPIVKMMKESIIVPEINYETYITEKMEDEAEKIKEKEEMRHKKLSEIYAHTTKEVFKVYILPEIKKIIKD